MILENVDIIYLDFIKAFDSLPPKEVIGILIQQLSGHSKVKLCRARLVLEWVTIIIIMSISDDSV